MKTPVFETGWSKFVDVQKSAEYRGRVEAYRQILEVIDGYKRPTPQLKAITKTIEEQLAKVKP